MIFPSRKSIGLFCAVVLVFAAFVFYSTRNDHSVSTSKPKSSSSSQTANKKSTDPRSEAEMKASAAARPCDRTVLTYLDLSRPPSEQELIAAGNLGEPLTPTRSANPANLSDTKQRARMEQDNLTFGTAIQAWNQHRYEEAYTLFENIVNASLDSPWAAESQLHLGCFCQYNGRLSEAAELFDGILTSVESKSEMYHKAKLRRSILHLDQGNLEASLQGFSEMKADDAEPRHQTYASYWIREIALLKKNETALRDCGQKALARASEIMGQPANAQELREEVAAGPHGFTAAELHATALSKGMDSRPVRADAALDELPLPFIAHYLDRHYVTVEQVTEKSVRLFDSRVGEATMPREAFLKQWSGFALIFSQPFLTAAIHPADNLDTIVGGCCGHPRSPSDLGDDGCDKNCGMPGWSVNPVNFNFRVGDTPLWWSPPVGPNVSMSLLFNSLDSLNNYEPFGEKWSFEYASYLLITPGSQVQVRDGDGRLETFTAPAGGGSGYPITYTPPAGDFRTLTETASHVFALTHQDGTVYHYGIPAAMTGNSSVPLLLSITDRHGNALTITHNAQGNILSIGHSMLPPLSGVARLWVFTYQTFNGHDRVSRIDDPFGRFATFGYDNDGNLKTQSDMGSLGYSYDYTTKLSQNAVSTNLALTSGYDAATNELFISAIHTPKGTTSILTEPSNGLSYTSNMAPELTALGYTNIYPPIGRLEMWTSYRIRITDPENKTEEYFFDGGTVIGYHRDPVQLNRPPGQTVAPNSGQRTEFVYTIVGGVKGKISTVTRIGSSSSAANISGNNYNSTLLIPTAVSNADNKWTSYEYNTNGTIKTLSPPKASWPDTDPYKIHYTYETSGPGAGVDPDKVQRYLDYTLYTVLDIDYWSGTRNLKQTTNALGQITGYTWNTNGLPASITDNTTGDVIAYVYDQGADDADGDPSWRLLKIKRNNLIMAQFGYDSIGRVIMQTNADGDYEQSTFDNLNRLTRTDRSDLTFAEQIWECCFVSETRSGKIVNSHDTVLERSKFFHDHRGLLTRSIDTAGKTTQFAYDDAGRMITLTDPMNRITSWIYDSLGRLDKKTYPDSTYEQTIWANMVRPNKFRNRNAQEFTPDYDSHGNFKSLVGPGVNVTRTYDAWNRLKTIQDTNYSSGYHTYEYDLLGRATSLDGPWSDDTINWNYYDDQREVTRTRPGGVLEGTFSDSHGRLSSIVNPLGTFTTAYDGDTERPLTITHSGGFNTTFSYYGDSLDRALHTITSTMPGGSTIAKHTYDYDSLGRITSWQREAPLVNPSGTTRSFEWKSYYDFASQLTSVVEKDLTGSLQGGWDYQYDLAGNIASVQSASGTSSPSALTKRSHNALNQITTLGGGGLTTIRGSLNEPGKVSVGISGSGDKPARMLTGNRFESELPLQQGSNLLTVAAFDGNYNRSTYTFSVNVSSQSANTFSYDNNGNLLSDGTRTYEWDGLSRLTKITWAAGKFSTFKYNALGQRCERVDTDGATVTNHYYLFDGIGMLDHRTGASANTATIDKKFFTQGEQRKNGAVWENYYYSRDHLGSIREVMKSVGGANTLATRYDYDSYGKRLTQYQASTYTGGCDFGFTGHVTAPSLVSGQTEMVLTHYRAYDPYLGRWLSADPIGESGGMNLYGYVGGNPLMQIDPFGLCPDGGLEPGSGLSMRSAQEQARTAAGIAEGQQDLKTVANGLAAATAITGVAAAGAAIPEGVAVLSFRAPWLYSGGIAALDETGVVAASTGTVIVSRWGREGLEAGDWVMKGGANFWNYLRSFKWQPGLGNEFSCPSSGKAFEVAKDAVKWPKGWGIDGWWKGLFGQRKYEP